MYWQAYNLLSLLTSKSGFHKCLALAINSPTTYVILCSQIPLVKKSIKDYGLTFESPLKLQSEFQVWLAVGLSKRLFASLVIIFTSIPILVRADLGNEYESQKRQKESLSWDNAQFTNQCRSSKPAEERYQVLKNGDVYRLSPAQCYGGFGLEITTRKQGNIYSVERWSKRECNTSSYGINCDDVSFEAQWKVQNCALFRYFRKIPNEIQRFEEGTCREGFTQRNK